jgi:archaellum component FlaC
MAIDYNFDKVFAEYQDLSDDFGFSAVSEDEYNKVVNESEQTVETYKDKLKEVEKLVIPFLQKLYQTADKEYIYWPNRKPTIEKQIEKILKLTRS